MNYTDKLIEEYLTEGHTIQTYKGYALDVNDDDIEDALETGSWSSLNFVSILDPQGNKVATAKSYSEARAWIDKNGNFINENKNVEIKLTLNDVPYKNYCKSYADDIKSGEYTLEDALDDFYNFDFNTPNTDIYNEWVAEDHKPTAEELMKYFPETMADHYRMHLIYIDEDNWGEDTELVEFCTNANGYNGDPDNLPDEVIMHLDGTAKNIITALYNSNCSSFNKPATKIYLDNFAKYIEDMIKNNKLTGTYSYDTPMGKMVVKIEINEI